MRFVPVGFFPKQVVRRPAWLDDPRVGSIRSVSQCISEGPPGWIDAWEHNDLGFYDTVDTAGAIGARLCEAPFELHGYRIGEPAYDAGRPIDRPLPVLQASEIPPGWTLLGYDVVSRTHAWFECSPLSCNGRWPDFDVNEHCLLPTLAEALRAAVDFSAGGGEPGPYHVIEVWWEPAARP